MQIVINIPEEVYEHAKDGSYTSIDESDAIFAIKHGTPLPSALEIIRCQDCKHYHEDVWADEVGMPFLFIVGHKCCDFWGHGTEMHQVSEDGFCFGAERKNNVSVAI